MKKIALLICLLLFCQIVNSAASGSSGFGGLCPINPVRSYTDITLDAENEEVKTFTYELSAAGYVKTGLAQALIFRINQTDPNNVKLCWQAADDGGWASFSYDPEHPECIDYWFIFCPHATATSPGPPRELCLNGTGLPEPLISGSILRCTDSPGSFTPKQYTNYLLSHNELYLCNPTGGNYNALCWPLMLIFGLLVGASFALGRNPFLAFDLSAPRMSRGKRYTMRAQQMSFDGLSYAFAAESAYNTIGKFKDAFRKKEKVEAKGAGSKGKGKDESKGDDKKAGSDGKRDGGRKGKYTPEYEFADGKGPSNWSLMGHLTDLVGMAVKFPMKLLESDEDKDEPPKGKDKGPIGKKNLESLSRKVNKLGTGLRVEEEGAGGLGDQLADDEESKKKRMIMLNSSAATVHLMSPDFVSFLDGLFSGDMHADSKMKTFRIRSWGDLWEAIKNNLGIGELSFKSVGKGIESILRIYMTATELSGYLRGFGAAFGIKGWRQHGIRFLEKDINAKGLLKLPGSSGRKFSVWEIARMIDNPYSVPYGLSFLSPIFAGLKAAGKKTLKTDFFTMEHKELVNLNEMQYDLKDGRILIVNSDGTYSVEKNGKFQSKEEVQSLIKGLVGEENFSINKETGNVIIKGGSLHDIMTEEGYALNKYVVEDASGKQVNWSQEQFNDWKDNRLRWEEANLDVNRILHESQQTQNLTYGERNEIADLQTKADKNGTALGTVIDGTEILLGKDKLTESDEKILTNNLQILGIINANEDGTPNVKDAQNVFSSGSASEEVDRIGNIYGRHEQERQTNAGNILVQSSMGQINTLKSMDIDDPTNIGRQQKQLQLDAITEGLARQQYQFSAATQDNGVIGSFIKYMNSSAKQKKEWLDDFKAETKELEKDAKGNKFIEQEIALRNGMIEEFEKTKDENGPTGEELKKTVLNYEKGKQILGEFGGAKIDALSTTSGLVKKCNEAGYDQGTVNSIIDYGLQGVNVWVGDPLKDYNKRTESIEAVQNHVQNLYKYVPDNVGDYNTYLGRYGTENQIKEWNKYREDCQTFLKKSLKGTATLEEQTSFNAHKLVIDTNLMTNQAYDAIQKNVDYIEKNPIEKALDITEGRRHLLPETPGGIYAYKLNEEIEKRNKLGAYDGAPDQNLRCTQIQDQLVSLMRRQQEIETAVRDNTVTKTIGQKLRQDANKILQNIEQSENYLFKTSKTYEDQQYYARSEQWFGRPAFLGVPRKQVREDIRRQVNQQYRQGLEKQNIGEQLMKLERDIDEKRKPIPESRDGSHTAPEGPPFVSNDKRADKKISSRKRKKK